MPSLKSCMYESPMVTTSLPSPLPRSSGAGAGGAMPDAPAVPIPATGIAGAPPVPPDAGIIGVAGIPIIPAIPIAAGTGPLPAPPAAPGLAGRPAVPVTIVPPAPPVAGTTGAGSPVTTMPALSDGLVSPQPLHNSAQIPRHRIRCRMSLSGRELALPVPRFASPFTRAPCDQAGTTWSREHRPPTAPPGSGSCPRPYAILRSRARQCHGEPVLALASRP